MASQPPLWLSKEREDYKSGKIPFDETWDYLKERGVPYSHYAKMKEKEYPSSPPAAIDKDDYSTSWEYLRTRGVSWTDYCRAAGTKY